MSISLNMRHANEIAASMAKSLGDNNFMNNFRKQASASHEEVIRRAISEGDQEKCISVYNAYFGGGQDDTALQTELSEKYGEDKAMQVSNELRTSLYKVCNPGPGSSVPQMAKDDGPKAQELFDMVEDVKEKADELCDLEMIGDMISAQPELYNTFKNIITNVKVLLENLRSETVEKVWTEGLSHDMDRETEVAVAFAMNHLVKVANALDNRGFAGVANIVDSTVKKLASKKR